VSFQINSTTVGRDASAKAMALNLGSAYARSESVSRLAGQGGRSDMLSLSVADGAQEFDQRTLQDHCVANTASDLLYKNSLDDKARTIFAGLIRVELGAHKTDAYQKVRNVLLSDEAEANSAPGLEIEADDVRCTHGATSGQVDAEEVFYLRSRGIGKKQAQRLIVHGFLQEVIDRLGDDAVGQRLTRKIHAKFQDK
jgi:Fe-S cluster assembly protein SufD